MTDMEKKLLQAQHRLEEAQARDRVKERKARTRRLIQEGAILEEAIKQGYLAFDQNNDKQMLGAYLII